MSATRNRPEIDGLRAVAVVPVVLFHAAVGFEGGYVGVDVFFVISGFLITSLILHDLNAGTFRIANFWERRVRRIMPALVAMVLLCIATAWRVLLPSDLAEFGRSVVAQSLLVSNFFFWQQSGYFTADAVQPLLHTWSLAVEEQFYLLFPLLLLGLKRLKPQWTRWSIGLIAIVSFGLSEYLCRTHPMAAFYLLPPRAWELLLGAFLAATPVSTNRLRWLDEVIGYVGLAGIAAAVFLYDKETRFPGLAALPPCLGTAAIIWSNSAVRTSLGRVLSLRPVVFVGLVSYSFYLWHWPVLVFANYWATAPLAVSDRLWAALLSFGLAVLSWRWVETPFRRRSVFVQRSSIFSFAGGSFACLVLAGAWLHWHDGVTVAWPARALRYFAGRRDRETRPEADLRSTRDGRLPELGVKARDRPIEFLVWGDSHARAILPVLDELCQEHKIRGVAVTHAASIPLLEFESPKKFSVENAADYNHAVVDFVRTRGIKKVLVAARWNIYLPADPAGRRGSNFGLALAKTVAELRVTGAEVFVMKDVPCLDFDVPRALAVAVMRDRDPKALGSPVTEHQARTEFENHLFDKITANKVTVLDPVPLLTDASGRCEVELDGQSLYADRHHLTRVGARKLRPLFAPIFE
jgi:peptidoglycan/LPS O-acetylase OafA/YrhL